MSKKINVTKITHKYYLEGWSAPSRKWVVLSTGNLTRIMNLAQNRHKNINSRPGDIVRVVERIIQEQVLYRKKKK